MRSFTTVVAFLALTACGPTVLSENDHTFLKAVDSVCGPAPEGDQFPDRLCEGYLVYLDGTTPVAKLTGITIADWGVSAHQTWRNPDSGAVISGSFSDEPDKFVRAGGWVVGPNDPDYAIIHARYLGMEGRPG